MKTRRDIILDFTSLLDVIMIMLFVVLGNANQKSNAEIQKNMDIIADAKSRIESLEEENDNLNNERNALLDELDYIKANTEYDETDTSTFGALLKMTTRILCVCSTALDPETKIPILRIELFRVVSDGEEKYFDTIELKHDPELPNVERQKLGTEQTTEMTSKLLNLLNNDTNPVILISIQYSYSDKNITRSDMSIIKRSIENVEKERLISCYMEELKLP